MKIKVQCPSCRKIKNAVSGNKSFRCCHLQFPVMENIYNKEAVSNMTSVELDGVAKKIAEIVISEIYNFEIGSAVLDPKRKKGV